MLIVGNNLKNCEIRCTIELMKLLGYDYLEYIKNSLSDGLLTIFVFINNKNLCIFKYLKLLFISKNLKREHSIIFNTCLAL